MGLQPLHNRVVVEPIVGGEKTSGGLIVPQGQKRPPNRGVVIHGNDEVTKGDIVLFTRYGGVAFQDQLVLEPSDVLAILGHVSSQDK